MTKISIMTYDAASNSWMFTDDATRAASEPWAMLSHFESYAGYFITVGEDEIVFCMGIVSDRALFDVYADARGIYNGIYPSRGWMAASVHSGEFTLDHRGLRVFGIGPVYPDFDQDFLRRMTDGLKEKFGVSEVFVGGQLDR
jgi:hypothetical protein